MKGGKITIERDSQGEYDNFVGNGMKGGEIIVKGYAIGEVGTLMDGDGEITIMGDAEGGVGRNMFGGKIIIHGDTGYVNPEAKEKGWIELVNEVGGDEVSLVYHVGDEKKDIINGKEPLFVISYGDNERSFFVNNVVNGLVWTFIAEEGKVISNKIDSFATITNGLISVDETKLNISFEKGEISEEVKKEFLLFEGKTIMENRVIR